MGLKEGKSEKKKNKNPKDVNEDAEKSKKEPQKNKKDKSSRHSQSKGELNPKTVNKQTDLQDENKQINLKAANEQENLSESLKVKAGKRNKLFTPTPRKPNQKTKETETLSETSHDEPSQKQSSGEMSESQTTEAAKAEDSDHTKHDRYSNMKDSKQQKSSGDMSEPQVTEAVRTENHHDSHFYMNDSNNYKISANDAIQGDIIAEQNPDSAKMGKIQKNNANNMTIDLEKPMGPPKLGIKRGLKNLTASKDIENFEGVKLENIEVEIMPGQLDSCIGPLHPDLNASTIASTVVVCFITLFIYKLFKSNSGYKAGQRIRQEAREKRDSELNDLKDHLDQQGLWCGITTSILNTPLKFLVNQLKDGSLKATDVLRSYQKKALDVHQKTNCIATIVLEAEQWAEARDADDKKDGVLHGVPVSVKEYIAIKGYSSSRAATCLFRFKAQDDSVLIKVLKQAGAVPFMRTNLPQMLMSYECGNPIYGETVHPLDATRTSGGSSGGDAALLGGGGSLLSIGSDIGGSLRLPAGFCGVAGLKPSSLRVSTKTAAPPEGQINMRASWGPMARDVDSLVLACKALFVEEMSDLDLNIPAIPFREDVYKSEHPLTIGYYVDDGWYPATPACARAVRETVASLERKGHKLVPWTPPLIDFAMAAWAQIITGDSGERFKVLLQNEEVHPSAKPFINLATMTKTKRQIKALIAKQTSTKKSMLIKKYAGTRSVSDWWKFTTQVEIYRRQIESEWTELGLDAVVCPMFTFPATKRGSAEMLLRCGSYLMLYNVIDFAAGVVPVTRVTVEDIKLLNEYQTGDDVAEFARRDAQGSAGLPVGVQCITKRWNDELCLRLMKEVEMSAI